MTEELAAALVALFDRLGPHAQTDPQLREAVLGLGRALTDWAEQVASAPVPEPVAAPAPTSQPAPQPELLPPPPVVIPSDFTLARPPDPVRPPVFAVEDDRTVTPADPTVIARRCRLKAAAARAVAARKRGELVPFDDLALRAGGLPDCDLWMLDPAGLSDAPPAWDDLAGAFAAGADAADLLGVLAELPDALAARQRDRILCAAAEAQSMIWAAVADVHRAKPDNDQLHLFVYVREQAYDFQIYISRYLKKGDRADPALWPALCERLAALRRTLDELRGRSKARDKGMKNLRYKLTKMAADPLAAAAGEWERVLELLEEVVAAGLPASNAEVRELLLPVVDTLPDELEPGPLASRVFDAVSEYRATRPPADESPPADEPSAE
ncbi:MAG: hypothetical protein K2V38_13085, partial [Gemmataceae bacterium]|nr:hypothetical protein [Gemmataceae bacterium]